MPRFARFMQPTSRRACACCTWTARHRHVRPRSPVTPTLEPTAWTTSAPCIGRCRQSKRAAVFGWGGRRRSARRAVRRHVPRAHVAAPPRRPALTMQAGRRTTRGGRRPDEEEEVGQPLAEIWGEDDHAARDRPAHAAAIVPRTAPGTTRPSCAGARQAGPLRDDARQLRAPSRRTEYETDARDGRAHHPRPRRRHLTKPGRASWRRQRRSSSGTRVEENGYCASLIPGARLIEVPGAATIPFFDRGRGLRGRDDRLPRVGPGRGGRARPHAGDGALHRHRRLDRQGLRARRPQVDRAARTPPPGGARDARPLSRYRGRAPPATASSPPSTGRRGR